MTPVYATKLGFNPQKIYVGTQIIDGSSLETHGMDRTELLLQDSLSKI